MHLLFYKECDLNLCDAMLAWYMLQPCVCVSVCHMSMFCQNSRTNRAVFWLSCTMF